MGRYDEMQDDEKEGIYKILGIIENVQDIKPDATEMIGKETYIFQWIVKRVSQNIEKMDDNKFYASEILSILLQNKKNQEYFGESNLLPDIQFLIDTYKAKNKFYMDEKEMIQNMQNSLSLTLMIEKNKTQFIMNEGIEIMLDCLKKKEFYSKNCYICIDFTLINNPQGCKFFIDAKGLKQLFPIFMNKALKEKNFEDQKTLDDHSISILFNLCLWVEETEFLRLVNKFKENDFEKLDRLIFYHNKYSENIEKVESERKVILLSKIFNKALEYG